MAAADSIIKYLSTLNKYEQQRVYDYLQEKLIVGSVTSEIKDEIKENRFSSGRLCPYCKKDRVLRKDKQFISNG